MSFFIFFLGGEVSLKLVMRNRMDEERPQTTLQVLSFSLSKNFTSSSLFYTSHAMFVCANTQTTDIVVFYMPMGPSTPHLPLTALLKLLLTMLGLEQTVLLLVT
jgi:hypothetical protein